MNGNDELPDINWVPCGDNCTVTYKTKSGNVYEFSFEYQKTGDIRLYIVRQPFYSSRAQDFHSTHRIYDGSRFYINWTGLLHLINDAKKVTATWADRTDRYIRTGQWF